MRLSEFRVFIPRPVRIILKLMHISHYLIHLHLLSLTKISLKIFNTSVNENFIHVFPRFYTPKVLDAHHVVNCNIY